MLVNDNMDALNIYNRGNNKDSETIFIVIFYLILWKLK